MKKKLALRRDVLGELTTDELSNLAGGTGTLDSCGPLACVRITVLDSCSPVCVNVTILNSCNPLACIQVTVLDSCSPVCVNSRTVCVC